MWIMLNDAFFSIVHKDCARDELLVRARRPGDIEKVFRGAAVTEALDADYRYRAAIKRADVAAVMTAEIGRVNYGNFKSSVLDKPLHDAYLQVWTAMSKLQPTRPYSQPYRGGLFKDEDGDIPFAPVDAAPAGKTRRKRAAKLKRGQ